jgi:hypothetical protein
MFKKENIGALLEGIGPESRNATGDIHLNIIKNEFILINGLVTIPHLPVKEMDYAAAMPVMRELVDYMPKFLCGHVPLVRRRPASEQHSVQVVRLIGGEFIDFIHLFSINLRYGGGEGTVLSMGDSTRYPAFKTDRIYYKSRLIPVRRVAAVSLEDFSPVRLIESAYIESDQAFHTFAAFDDMDPRDATRGIYSRMKLDDIFSTSQDLYPFISFDHFTACLNVPDPLPTKLLRACELYEPLFIYIYGQYREAAEIAPLETLAGRLPLELVDGRLECTGVLRDDLRRWFGRYTLVRDDDLALKGWWRFDCNE